MMYAVLCSLQAVVVLGFVPPPRVSNLAATPRTRFFASMTDSGDREAAALEEGLLRNLMTQKLSGKSDDEIVEEIGEYLEADLEKVNALRGEESSTTLNAELLPPKGAEEWGRWSQDEDFISLELFVDASITAKDVLCEVSVGFLDVRLKDTPLLSGRLAQQVIVSELNWALDDDATLDDGRRVLCVELPKRERAIYGDNESFTEPLFQSLRIGEGEKVVGSGLVA